MKKMLIAILFAALSSSYALGGYIITQTADQAPTYAGHTANFNEADVPVDVAMDPFEYYSASDGVTFTSGNGFMVASEWDASDAINGGTLLPGDRQLAGGFNVNMMFDQPVTELSWQGWASGSPGFPFGGINAFLFSDGVEVAAYFGSFAPFGGVGDTWFNVTTTDGMTFDEVRFFNPAFNSFQAYVDNVSWNNVVPEPSGLALSAVFVLAFAGLRRRK